MPRQMPGAFVGEALVPVPGSFALSRMAAGEPGLPAAFVWRDCTYRVAEVVEEWKTTRPCHHGGDERYVRKHWYRIRTVCGAEMTLYFDRQPPAGRGPKGRWTVFTFQGDPDPRP
jgi:hypothetical protein